MLDAIVPRRTDQLTECVYNLCCVPSVSQNILSLSTVSHARIFKHWLLKLLGEALPAQWPEQKENESIIHFHSMYRE